MPTLVTPPKLLNSVLDLANGMIVSRVTAPFAVGTDVVVAVAARGVVLNGEFKNEAGTGAFVLPATPSGYAVEIWLILNEWRDGRAQTVTSSRTVSVLDQATVTWNDLVDVAPGVAPGDYLVPSWVASTLAARDTAVTSADTATTKAAEAAASAASIVGQMGVANGYASLDGSALLPEAQVPTRLTEAVQSATFVKRGDLVYNVNDFAGVIGDGVADDTTAIQAAIDSLPEYATLLFTRTYNVTSITLNTRFVTLTGSGRILNGKLRIGTTGTRRDLFIEIAGLTFEGPSATPTVGSYGIELLKARVVNIHHNKFVNLDKAVYVSPLADAIAHDTSMITVDKNHFTLVNYAMYGDRDPAVTWQHFADSRFTGNMINLALITAVWVYSVDGIDVSHNTTFFPSSTSTNIPIRDGRRNSLYIGASDWIHVAHNNFFEAGLEGILLADAKHFSVIGNLIAWPGQNVASDGIKITGTSAPNGSISDNTVSRFTGNGIGVYSTGAGTYVVRDNVLEYIFNTTTYLGSPALTTFDHFGVYQDSASGDNVFESGNQNSSGIYNKRKGSLISTVRLDNHNAASASRSPLLGTAFTALTAAPIFTVQSSAHGIISFSGLIHVEAKSSDSESGNLSSYLLYVSKHPLGTTVTVISNQGLLTGSSANWPSFTFSLDDTTAVLSAVPVGQTAGTFFFFATTLGNLRLI